ncbi:Rieske (2Fe-2S) protein [Adhaeribacter rhizoryzae]|uniref:Rieske 2Fe-2S domain-containing protein n=1 Tax=Adhaeribacter rhizoryzae TaxID=2607907 RepID=A0A5M6DTF7_9BACT|nr:Rieske 2Fe-2S domain-containing protein [Adhaeribacter rhizoryzae]KAA5549556.1 Rieske 2Fe-2S domain-containing protein [Adhaeribacter rhizoryzae]
MAWHKIFNSTAEAMAAIPTNKPKLFIIEGQRICLARTAAGFFAVDDECPHLGESLSKGTTNYLNEVVCPWHSYRYSLANGAECKYRTRSVKTYPTKQEADGLYIEV